MTTGFRKIGWGLLIPVVAVVILAQAFIDLDLAVDLPHWHLDAPLADVAGAALVVALPWLWRERRPVPAPWAALAFGVAALVSAFAEDKASTNETVAEALHWLVRKPVFCYVAYAVALPWALARVDVARVRQLLLAAVVLTASVSIATSLLRFASGDGLWWARIEGLTPNHKTLAVWLAPFLPWLWQQRARVAGALAVVALALSLSKSGMIAGAFGLAFAVHVGGTPLVARWKATAVALLLAVAVAVTVPVALGSRTMLDAERSRHSLDLRAWQMWTSAPILGQGPGSSVTWEMTEYPDYRVNGVEAHGAVQKVAAEEGLVGVAAWVAFGIGLFRGLSRAGDTRGEAFAWLGVAAALYVNLLASTEAFTMTHWIPLGTAWFFVRRESP